MAGLPAQVKVLLSEMDGVVSLEELALRFLHRLQQQPTGVSTQRRLTLWSPAHLTACPVALQRSACCLPAASRRACWTCCASPWDTATAAARPCSPAPTPNSSPCGTPSWQGFTTGQAGRRRPRRLLATSAQPALCPV